MKFLTSILALFIAVASLTAATNSPPAKPRAAASQTAGRGLPFHGTIAAVDKVAKTITMEGKKQRVFHLTPETKINRDNVKASLDAVTAGIQVGGYARELPDGKMNLVTLNIHTGAAKPAKPTK
jgi:hypothetical protein